MRYILLILLVILGVFFSPTGGTGQKPLDVGQDSISSTETTLHVDIQKNSTDSHDELRPTTISGQEEVELRPFQKIDVTSGQGTKMPNVVQKKHKEEKINLPGMKVFDHKRITDFTAFELNHIGRRIVANLQKLNIDKVVPISKVELKGQGMNLNLGKEDIIEEFIGEDISPDVIDNLKGAIVTKNVNGLPERFYIFSYYSAGRNYSLEPSEVFQTNFEVEKSINYESKVIQDVFINGINHTVYEVETRSNFKTETFHLPLVVVVDDSIIDRFKNASRTDDVAFEEAKKYLMAMEEVVMVELNELSTPAFSFTTKIVEVTRYRETATSIVDEENVDVQRLLENEESLPMHTNEIVLFLTKKRIVHEGIQVPGIGSPDICNYPKILMTVTEHVQTSKDLVQLLRKLLDICEENQISQVTKAVCQKETMEENLRIKKQCLGNLTEDHGWSGLVRASLSLQVQCTFAFGPGYIPCIPQGVDNVCIKFGCRPQESITCFSLSGMRPLPGSPCGPGMICTKGKCKLDVGAPLIYEWPFGGIYPFREVTNGTDREDQVSIKTLVYVFGSSTLALVTLSVALSVYLVYGKQRM